MIILIGNSQLKFGPEVSILDGDPAQNLRYFSLEIINLIVEVRLSVFGLIE